MKKVFAILATIIASTQLYAQTCPLGPIDYKPNQTDHNGWYVRPGAKELKSPLKFAAVTISGKSAFCIYTEDGRADEYISGSGKFQGVELIKSAFIPDRSNPSNWIYLGNWLGYACLGNEAECRFDPA